MNDKDWIDEIFAALQGLDAKLLEGVRKERYTSSAAEYRALFSLPRKFSLSKYKLFNITSADRKYDEETERIKYLQALFMMYVIKGANTFSHIPYLKTMCEPKPRWWLESQIFWVHKNLLKGEDQCRDEAAKIALEWTRLPDGKSHGIKDQLHYIKGMGNCQGHVNRILYFAGCFSLLNLDDDSLRINAFCSQMPIYRDLWDEESVEEYDIKPGKMVVFVPKNINNANHVVMFVGHGLIPGYKGPCYMSANTPLVNFDGDKEDTNLYNGRSYSISPRLMKHKDLIRFCPQHKFPRMVAPEPPPWKYGTPVLR